MSSWLVMVNSHSIIDERGCLYIVDSECFHEHRVVSHYSEIAFAFETHCDEFGGDVCGISCDARYLIEHPLADIVLRIDVRLLTRSLRAGDSGIGGP